MLCGDIRTEIVEHKIYLHTSTLSHVGHVTDNIGEAGPKCMQLSHRYVSLMHSFSVTSMNIAINHISLKLDFFVLYFRRRLYRPIFDHFDVIGP